MLNIEIKNLDEFLKKFSELNVKKTLNISLKKSIIFLEWVAKKETPVDKWFLHNSYETFFQNLEWKLVNTRKYGVAVHEWHSQTPWKFIPALWKRLVKSYVKWNPFLTRAAKIWNKQVNVFFNSEVNKMLNSLKI